MQVQQGFELIIQFLFQMKEVKNSGKNRKGRKRVNMVQAQDQNLSSELTDKFKKYLEKKRINYLKTRIHEYFGKNFVVNYQERFNFEQQWQEPENSKFNYVSQKIIEENPIEIGSYILMTVGYTLGIWISMIDLIFRNSLKVLGSSDDRSIYETLYAVAIGTMLLDLILKIKKKMDNGTFECSAKSLVKLSYKEIICIMVYLMKLQLGQINVYTFLIPFDLLVMVLVYLRASTLYKSLRLISFSLYYQYHSKIFDLIITLVLILHGIATTLFLTTFAGYNKNWLSQAALNNQNQFVVYIYSFYFGSSTILTVGYGDLSPKNPVQTAVIILVQIIGVATLGYIINQIGYCISNLRKVRQTMQKDLSIILKMNKHYNMNDKLLKQARTFIINQNHQPDQLYPTEEKYLLQKFNQDLRNNIHKENLSSIVKSSIFFLTRWSKNFQLAASKKVQHILFSFNDILYQPKFEQRIYLIKRGKISIYAEKGGRKKGLNNLLKTIDTLKQKQISDNCYGYTAVISSRPSRLYAISKDNTSAYYIEKKQFLDCLSQRMSDYEYYHEIKDKMDQSQNWQAFEAPIIDSSKNHFNPTKRSIIQRYLHNAVDKNIQRQFYQRKKKKAKFLLIHEKSQKQQIINKFQSQDSKREFSLSSLSCIENGTNIYQNNILDTVLQEAISIQQRGQSILSTSVDLRQNLHHLFEISKEYSNYFHKQNQTQILRKLDLENIQATFQTSQINNLYRGYASKSLQQKQKQKKLF